MPMISISALPKAFQCRNPRRPSNQPSKRAVDEEPAAVVALADADNGPPRPRKLFTHQHIASSSHPTTPGSLPSKECSEHLSVRPLREIATSLHQTPQMNTCASKFSHGRSNTSQAQTSMDFAELVDSSKECTENSTSATTPS